MKKLLPKIALNPQGFTFLRYKKAKPVLKFHNAGFTLIELLIVVTIISILTVIGITVYSGIQKNARDAVRKADIDAIANAMEANYSKTTAGTYDALAASMFSQSVVPTDPSNGQTGCGSATGPCNYCVRATAGQCVGGTTGDTKVGPGQPPSGATFTVCANLENYATNAYYCRSNQQ